MRDDGDAEFEQQHVGDAVVTRQGDHYRIESGGESWAELERLAEQIAGKSAAAAPPPAKPDRNRRLHDLVTGFLAARGRR
jgi:hypothetical protein